MFYLPVESMEPCLRFGDVIQGVFSITLGIDSLSGFKSSAIKMDAPRYSVVLTPCCAIEDGSVLLSPLLPVSKEIMKSPYIAENPLRMNTEFPGYLAIVPKRWNNFSSEEQQQYKERPPAYYKTNLFAYDQHDLFEPFDMLDQRSCYYMVDFKRVFRVDCNVINRNAPADFRSIKLLQLSVDARTKLRFKMSKFYGKVPDEENS